MASNTTTSKSINIEHLEEQSDIIIYIVGLIIIIIWKTSETDEVGGNGEDVSDLVETADLVEVFGNDDSRVRYILCSEQFHQSGTHSRSVWSMYLVKTEGWEIHEC